MRSLPSSMLLAQAALLSQLHSEIPGAVKLSLISLSAANSSAVSLEYYGGPVISNVQVTPIFYGENADFKTEIVNYYSFLVTSSWMNIFSQYDTPTQHIRKGGVAGFLVETVIKTYLDDINDIQPYLRSLVLDGRVMPTPNSYYPIHLQFGINVTSDSGLSCETFGGYHSYVYIADISQNAKYLWYGVIPNCGPYPDLYSMSYSISHELAEAITDPIPGASWYNRKEGPENGEIGDICVGIGSTVLDSSGVLYGFQELFSNAQTKCVGIVNSTDMPSMEPLVEKSATRTIPYNGGPVLHNIEITPIFYGPDVAYQQNLTNFYSFIVSSEFMSVLNEYGNGEPVANGSLLSAIIDPQASTTDIRSYLRNLVMAGSITPSNNSYFPVHIGPSVNLTINGISLCPYYCSITDAIFIGDISSSLFLIYSVIPDMSGACASVCGSSPDALHNLQALSSVQLARAITNGANAYTGFSGWFDSTSGGVTDGPCAWSQYPLYDSDHHLFVVGKIWSNVLQMVISLVLND
ncbi:hypothetical protein HDU83_002360 [Entophlyctis luteolus]|nr:hypothetical protein HDU83_002360 [Entophlyctis luteolus]